MAKNYDYAGKFAAFQDHNLYAKLSPEQQNFIRHIAFTHHFTWQELCQIVEVCRDLTMWNADPLERSWKIWGERTTLEGKQLKVYLLQNMRMHMNHLRCVPPVYPERGQVGRPRREARKVRIVQSGKKIYGKCPVGSTKTVCCNLYTIDAVQNCVFECSYCSIQTFGQEQIVFDQEFNKKLQGIELEYGRFYRFGTGQASDSLAWGNRHGNLDALFRFAVDHPHILLEFKTKSDNIKYLLDHETPRNIVCAWSLNTAVIIDNEEHLTASLDRRIRAARLLADQGIKVAFHFHPMIYYAGWHLDYPGVARTLMERFSPEEVLFISFGSLTLIGPVIKKIRDRGVPTKVLQMDFVHDPHGKMTYPDEIKISMFNTMYDCFRPWQGKVFMYLCMEKAGIWEKAFGYVYRDNDEFERAFAAHAMGRIDTAPRWNVETA